MALLRKLLWSAAKLALIVCTMTFECLSLAMRGDFAAAKERFCGVLIFIHDDVLNAIVHAQRRLRFREERAKSPKRVLVVKLDRLGDMVTLTPALSALRESCPSAEIDLVAHPVSIEVIRGDDRLTSYFTYKSSLYISKLPSLFPLGKLLLVRRLMRRNYDLVVISRGSFLFWGFGLFTRILATKYVPAEPVVTRNLKMLEPLFGQQPARPLQLPHRQVSLDVTGEYVVMHASASALAKSWPSERFAQLADQMSEVTGLQTHFLGSPGERSYLEEVLAACTHDHELRTDLSLAHLVEYIRAAKLFVGNDSGLSHIAAAVDTPLVVVWGPTDLSTNCPHTTADKRRVLYHEIACREQCTEFRCHNREEPQGCMLRTEVSDVMAACVELLEHDPRIVEEDQRQSEVRR